MNKKKNWKVSPFIIIFTIAIFMLGFSIGMLIQQQIFIKSGYEIARGLEGTEFNIEIDINETIMVDRMMEYFNETEDFRNVPEKSK